MQLWELGERALIDSMIQRFGLATLDDCSTIDDGEHWLLVTSDMAIESIHFPPSTTPYLMGWFVVAINLSDIAAAGGVPEGIMLSLGLPPNLEVDFLNQLAEGIQDCVSLHGTSVIGGDTKESPTITLCGTALGRVPKKNYLSRRGASPGDAVCVTGVLGSAGAALQNLRGKVDLKTLDHLLKISPRLAAGQAAAATGGVTAAMDISDGLSSSLYQLMNLNKVGFQVDANRVPISDAARAYKMPIDLALHAGGDYELLMTVTPDALERVQRVVNLTGIPLTPIGLVIDEQHIVLISNGEENPLPNRGHEHFRKHGKTL